jgi:hypothetical protein
MGKKGLDTTFLHYGIRKDEIDWEVPVQSYNPEIYKKDEAIATHALELFYEYKAASTSESF